MSNKKTKKVVSEKHSNMDKFSFFFKIILFSTIIFFSTVKSYSQEAWNLEKCIDYAIQNNKNLEQLKLQLQLAENEILQDKLKLLPSVNGAVVHGYNWGQTVDRYTNTFASQRVQSDNFYLSSSVMLFNGFQNLNKIRQSKANVSATQYDTEKYIEDLTLLVVNSYLQILFATESLKIAEQQLESTQMQVDRLTKLVNAGTISQGDLFNIQAQEATEKTAIIDAQNQLEMTYLQLMQLLNLQYDSEFKIEIPNIQMPQTNPFIYNTETIYDENVEKRPEIKSMHYKLQAADFSLKQAKALLYPSLSLQGSLGTGYSGAATKLERMTLAGEKEIGYYYFNNLPQPVYTAQFDPVFSKIPFKDQINDNVNKSVSLQLSIPIFNGWSVQNNIKRAKITKENLEIDLEIKKQDVRKVIQKAYLDTKAAYNKNKSAEASVKSVEEAYRYSEQKFENGMMTATEYNISKANLQRAKSQLLQSKYEYIFKNSILKLYMGESPKI